MSNGRCCASFGGANLNVLLNQNSDIDLVDFLSEPVDLFDSCNDDDECEQNDPLNTSSFLFDNDNDDTETTTTTTSDDIARRKCLRMLRKVDRIGASFIKNVLVPLNDEKIEAKLLANTNQTSDELKLNDYFILVDGIDDAILQSKRLTSLKTNNNEKNSRPTTLHPIYESKPQEINS